MVGCVQISSCASLVSLTRQPADMQSSYTPGLTLAYDFMFAQNTVGVTGIHVVPAASLRQQMDAVLSDIGADAVKTGMLPDVQVWTLRQMPQVLSSSFADL